MQILLKKPLHCIDAVRGLFVAKKNKTLDEAKAFVFYTYSYFFIIQIAMGVGPM